MGYGYRFEGTVSIVPPLNFAEIRQAQQIALGLVVIGKKTATEENVFSQHMPLMPIEDSFTKDTPEGVLHVKLAHTLMAPKPDHFMPINMDALVRALIKGLPGHNWNGSITAIRDDGMVGYKLTVNSDGDKSRVLLPEVVRQVQGEAAMVWEDAPEDHEPLCDLI